MGGHQGMPIRNVFSPWRPFLLGLPGWRIYPPVPSPCLGVPQGRVGMNSGHLQAELLQGTEALGPQAGRNWTFCRETPSAQVNLSSHGTFYP